MKLDLIWILLMQEMVPEDTMVIRLEDVDYDMLDSFFEGLSEGDRNSILDSFKQAENAVDIDVDYVNCCQSMIFDEIYQVLLDASLEECRYFYLELEYRYRLSNYGN